MTSDDPVAEVVKVARDKVMIMKAENSDAIVFRTSGIWFISYFCLLWLRHCCISCLLSIHILLLTANTEKNDQKLFTIICRSILLCVNSVNYLIGCWECGFLLCVGKGANVIIKASGTSPDSLGSYKLQTNWIFFEFRRQLVSSYLSQCINACQHGSAIRKLLHDSLSVKREVCDLLTFSLWKWQELGYCLATELSQSQARVPGTVFPEMFALPRQFTLLRNF